MRLKLGFLIDFNDGREVESFAGSHPHKKDSQPVGRAPLVVRKGNAGGPPN